ncbi:uncharacterized protein LOC103493322 isoform X3 [Cucumis melo]|uniref:Uncharacterized protein LOC103493322 isoform X3 n=1 Tax=Cucumis melo TaxID=3656 RepID=A0ABM3KY86_CUCME|nr:uncharacterized protein LOC103493322 isoform X3 [Cucumis melo]
MPTTFNKKRKTKNPTIIFTQISNETFLFFSHGHHFPLSHFTTHKQRRHMWRVSSWGKEIEPKNVMNRLREEERYMRNNCGLHHILSYLCSFLLPNHFLSSLELYGYACAWYSIAVRLAMELEVLDANYPSKLNKNFRWL